MKKKSKINNNEIELIDLIRLILNNKLILILFISVSIIIGGFYHYNLPNSLKFSLKFTPVNNSEFINYTAINQFIKSNRVTDYEEYLVSSSKVFEKFLDEFLDYEELIFILKNNKVIKGQVSQLSMKDRNMLLGSIARSFTLEPVFDKEDRDEPLSEAEVEYIWNDKSQGIDILNQTLNSVLKNLEDRINNDLEKYLNRVYINKKQEDLARIEFLEEQSLIAKESNIKDNQSQDSFYSIQTYYLLGYRAIDKEISLIKSREYKDILFLLKEIKELKKQNKREWINYNINLIEINNLKPSILEPLMISIIIGLIIGIVYIVIYSMIKDKK